jgi:hypothetical protein
MADKITELNPARDIEVFFDKLFGSHKGYVYCPVTAPKDASDWEIWFFKWPEEKEKLVNHIVGLRATKEIYFSPVLFKEPDLQREALKGTQYLWAEFNGETPTPVMLKDIPDPTLKIRTSNVGHEVWLWDISYFEEDLNKVEDTVKRIALKLKADMSAWHYESVFRCPNTTHHRTGLNSFLTKSDNRTTIDAFSHLQKINYLTEDNFKEIPNLQRLLVTHNKRWTDEEWSFFTKRAEQVPHEKRYKALMRLAFTCADKGYDDSEILAVLLNADARWGHYVDRGDVKQKKALIGIINFVRTKKPHQAFNGLENSLLRHLYTPTSLIESEFKVEWIIEGLIEKQGFGLVTGDSGTGKSRFLLSMCIHLAMGKDFLGWKVPRPMKMLFFSLEMNGVQLKIFMEKMVSKLSDEERKLVDENFDLLILGESNNMHIEKEQPKTIEVLQHVKPDGVIIDSLGSAVLEDMENATVINRIFNFVNKEMRNACGAFVLFIHHHRKHGDSKPTKDDIFGSVYIRNQMTTILTLHRISSEKSKEVILRLTAPKLRLSEDMVPVKIRSIPETLQYEIYGNASKINAKGAPLKKIQELETDIDDDDDPEDFFSGDL